jgi:3'(2'), 5'-bisphosphate nucleotidase
MDKNLIEIIRGAGKEILKFCGNSKVTYKEDKSPFTLADQASHNFLCTHLVKVRNIPILSEEHDVPYEVRKNWKEFWLIDPLDGTKEFINGLDDFCINIALIQNNKPVLGIIYAPRLDELYCAEHNKGFQYIGPPHLQTNHDNITVGISRFHHSEKTSHFMKINHLYSTYTIAAALKFGRMALGQIDLYPRFEGSKEWDTAAGQIILKESGYKIIDLITGHEPVYNKPTIKNNYFIAFSTKIDVTTLNYGELL